MLERPQIYISYSVVLEGPKIEVLMEALYSDVLRGALRRVPDARRVHPRAHPWVSPP